jgi:hypothetical protein
VAQAAATFTFAASALTAAAASQRGLISRRFQLQAPARAGAPWRAVAATARHGGAVVCHVRPSSRSFTRRVLSATFSTLAAAAAFAQRWQPVVGVAVAIRRAAVAGYSVSVPVL